MKRKRLYEQQVEQLGNFQLRIHDQVTLFLFFFLLTFDESLLTTLSDDFISLVVKLQMIMLEGAKATTETVDALRTGAATMKVMQKATFLFYIYPNPLFFFFNLSSD